MSLVTPSHRHLLGRIEKMTKTKISEGVIPTRKALGIKKVARVLSSVLEQTRADRAMELMEAGWSEALEGMSKEEIAGRFLSMMFPEIFADERPMQMERGTTGAYVRPERSERSDDRVSRAGDRRERRQEDFRERPKREFGDRPKRDFKRDRPERDFEERPKREFKREAPEGGFETAPKRDFSDRPKRSFGDRPKRPFGDRPGRDFNRGPKREFGDKPKRDFKRDRPERDFEARPKRGFEDRPKRGFEDRPKRDFSDRGERDFGARPFKKGPKPFAKPGKFKPGGPFKGFKKPGGGFAPPRRKSDV
jgi:hypothetical protein